MYWQDKNTESERSTVARNMTDVVYGIDCRALP